MNSSFWSLMQMLERAPQIWLVCESWYLPAFSAWTMGPAMSVPNALVSPVYPTGT